MSSLAEMAAIFVAPKDRDAVLGDLAEKGASGWSALGSVLGLVVRQQMELWRAWQPWVAVSVAFAGGREMSTFAMIEVYMRTLAVALSLFFWMFALTARLPSETRAALIAMGVLISWLIVTFGLSQSWSHGADPSPFWAASPFVFLLGFQNETWAVPLSAAALLQTVVAVLLWLWAARQLASEAEGRS